MSQLQPIHIGAMDPHRFEAVLTPSDYEALLQLIKVGSRALEGRVVWNVNSTGKGGGVVELLTTLLGYSRGAGVDARWKVISGTPEFFELTKRIHNHLHGFNGDGGGLTEREGRVYEDNLAGNADELAKLVDPNDIVILHDPQTAGLVEAVRATGATVIWRCHVGLDVPNRHAHEAWDFLRQYVVHADAYVFSRSSFAWAGLEPEKIAVIQPSIDAFSPKNQDLSEEQRIAILSRAGILTNGVHTEATFARSDGTPGRVDRRADVLELAPLQPTDRVVVQVSRWDKLKDPLGVIKGFAEYVAPHVDAHIVLAGPSTESVADDPEGAGVLAAVRDAWHGFPEEIRARVHLASLPMTDVDENAAIVNALQRHAEVIVQKSLAEGFGLTVAEAMWKERPVVGTRVGGIQDQIVDEESGVLIDPSNLAEYGAAVLGLLTDTERARRIGEGARERIRSHFLAPQHLGVYFELIQSLLAARAQGELRKAS